MASAVPSGVKGQSPWSGSQGTKSPEAESLFAFGHPTKATKFAELNVSGKMYLLHLTAMHLCENEGCMKITNTSAKNRLLKRTKALRLSCLSLAPMNVLATEVRFMASTPSV